MKLLIPLLALTVLTCHAKLIRRTSGDFTLRASLAGKNVKQDVYYYAPRKITSDTPVVIVMHGNQRNAETYRDAWEDRAKDENLVILVPEFSDREFRGSSGYNLAGMMNSSGVLTPRKHWAFPLIDQLFLAVKEDQELDAGRFYLYGHSAGSQFVHRYAMFANSTRLGLAIAANAGWYTFPTKDEAFPYGLGEAAAEFDANQAFATKMILLLGSNDTDPDHKYLRKTKEALKQGAHRYERGMNFFDFSRKTASAQKLEFNWSMQRVPGVGHSNSGMSKAALKIILETPI